MENVSRVSAQDISAQLGLSTSRRSIVLWDSRSTLLEALRENFEYIDPSSWQQRLEIGGVFVNGKRSTSDHSLTSPCRIEYFEPNTDLETFIQSFPKISQEHILHCQDGVAVVFKPAGIPTMPTRDQCIFHLQNGLLSVLNLKESDLHIPSRLDCAVSGVVLVSVDKKNHARVQKWFEKRLVSKEYLAAVSGEVEWEERLVDLPIGRHANTPILRSCEAGAANGKPAQTVFRRISTKEHVSTIKACPITGRTHQIRVHAQSLGLPLIGDTFYGGPPASQLRLQSYKISFPHISANENIEQALPRRFLAPWLDDLALKSLNI